MRKPFSIKRFFLIESRSFNQKYKFSNKNDTVCTWRNFQKKKSCGIFTYDKSKWNFKPQFPFWQGKWQSNCSRIRFKGVCDYLELRKLVIEGMACQLGLSLEPHAVTINLGKSFHLFLIFQVQVAKTFQFRSKTRHESE